MKIKYRNKNYSNFILGIKCSGGFGHNRDGRFYESHFVF